MKKILKLIAILLMLAGGFSSCQDDDYNPLLNTKWKLVGIVDAETGDLRELEPKDCDDCYTLTFDTDNTFSGRITVNIVLGRYKINYKTDVHSFTAGIATGAIDGGDGYLYGQILVEIQSFTINDTFPRILYLHYNNGKNYLKFKEIGG